MDHRYLIQINQNRHLVIKNIMYFKCHWHQLDVWKRHWHHHNVVWVPGVPRQYWHHQLVIPRDISNHRRQRYLTNWSGANLTGEEERHPHLHPPPDHWESSYTVKTAAGGYNSQHHPIPMRNVHTRHWIRMPSPADGIWDICLHSKVVVGRLWPVRLVSSSNHQVLWMGVIL